MERRPNQRCITKISIACSHLSSSCRREPIDGVILNTCPDGFYAELKAHVKAGTIIVVRTTGFFSENSMNVGVRSQSLAQVRWSKPILVDKEICYATGLQYVMEY
jgi:dihydrodipicolinate reductase